MVDRTHPLDRLDVSSCALKRVQYEALAFFIRSLYVEVQDHRYSDPLNQTAEEQP